MNNSVWASGQKIIITIRIIMFILLFIVLRHQYLCSAVRTVCSYTANAPPLISKQRGVCLCVCVVRVVLENMCEVSRIGRLRRARQKSSSQIFFISYGLMMIIPRIAGSVPAFRLRPWKAQRFSCPAEIWELIILSLVDQWYIMWLQLCSLGTAAVLHPTWPLSSSD